MRNALVTNVAWEVEGEGRAACHSLVIGGVLCRWWGEEEPPGHKLLEALAAFVAVQR